MHKNNMFRMRKTWAAALFAIAVALLCFVLFRESREQGIEGWTPVNEALQEAIGSLASPSEVEGEERQAAADLTAGQGTDQSTDQPSQPPSPISSQTPSPASSSPAAEVGEETPREASPGTLDLNRATEADLDALPGIGPSKAKAILAHRDKIGGFRRVEQLLDVKGIGPKVFEHLSGLVHVAAAK
ncbi:ComEA family DNA-binding protein [Cohnella phaseoli]|uniref:Competence protein ComEA n=1 Tax=Cohnella phaseoli TaxID=456490 RepID=A0A3D9IRJ3_9BACL|nr:helix-hairpin-helix domain-containing protein [Cohnella phaseoli]RED64297.1 competence protein ComEA [Cohnella phaseoli]